jgi:hypothetical protein
MGWGMVEERISFGASRGAAELCGIARALYVTEEPQAATGGLDWTGLVLALRDLGIAEPYFKEE